MDVKQYDLLLHIMVPAEIDHINTTVSDEKYNLLTDHARFSLDHIAFWTVFFKSHPADPTDSVSDTNLLQDYLLNCITGRLKSEVHKKFYKLPEDEQGAATLIYLALSKLHSNSYACVQALQGSVNNFKLSQIAYEDVSIASSWLRAIIKTLKVTNDIPSQAIGSILAGMSTSSFEQFNTYVSVLESIDYKPTGLSCTAPSTSTYLADGITSVLTSVLEKCNTKYRDLVQTGRWPKVKPVTQAGGTYTESTLVASSAPSSVPASLSDSSFAKKLLESIPAEDLLALVLNSGDAKKCFNPLCNSDKHLVGNCPGPFPKDWNHNYRRNGARSNSRGRSSNRSKSSEHNIRKQPREQTPGLCKKSSVSFNKSSKSKKHNVYKASVEAEESEHKQDHVDDDDESTASEYNSEMCSAFLLRQSKD
jgi:hypothetical protein